MSYDTLVLRNPKGSGSWLSSQLIGQYAASQFPAGMQAFTTDKGMLIGNGVGWLAGGSSIVSTIKSAISAANVANPVTAQPLIAPPAWVALTAYAQGTSVTNGSNAYVCIAGGTSAGAGGPTGTGSAPIVDATCSWYYWGPTFTSSAVAPTITNVVFASRYTGLFWTTALNTYAIGSAKLKDNANFLFYGAVGTDGAGTNNSYQFNTNALIGGVIFMTDAPQFQIVIPANVGPSINIYVNNVPCTLGMTFNATGNQFIQMVFPDRRPRQITFECQTNLIPSFYGVLMNDTVSHVWAPPPAVSFNMSFVGTSYFDGSGNHPVTASLGIASQIARLLGCQTYWIDRLGSGTGYVNVGSTAVFNGATRLAALAAAPTPDLMIISGGGINDYTTFSNPGPTTAGALAIEQAACLTYYQSVRALFPNAIICVIGSESGATGPSASVFNMELAVSQAVAQLADPYVFYIPQSYAIAEQSWVSGTGNSVTTNGSGNSDFFISADNIHPVQLGVNYLAQRSAAAIAKVISTLS